MYTLILHYPDGKNEKFFQVTKVEYDNLHHYSLTGEDLYNHCYPTNCTLHIFSKERNVIHTLKNVQSLEIKKEAE